MLIYSDMDGTFLAGTPEGAERNREAIEAFRAAGGLFSFATGRILSQIDPACRALANAPMVLGTGALGIAQDGTILWEEFLDHKIAERLFETVHAAFPEMHCAFHKNEQTGAYYKVVFWGSAEAVPEIRRMAYETYGDALEGTSSNAALIEFTRGGVCKASGILRAKAYVERGGGKLTLYAMGDYQNDEDMLLAADIAVCPDNASDRIKEICAVHLCHCDEGAVADLIEKIREERES